MVPLGRRQSSSVFPDQLPSNPFVFPNRVSSNTTTRTKLDSSTLTSIELPSNVDICVLLAEDLETEYAFSKITAVELRLLFSGKVVPFSRINTPPVIKRSKVPQTLSLDKQRQPTNKLKLNCSIHMRQVYQFCLKCSPYIDCFQTFRTSSRVFARSR